MPLFFSYDFDRHYSCVLAGDLHIQLSRERERRERAEVERDESSSEQQLLMVTLGQKEGRVRELAYEVDLQRQRTHRVEGEVSGLHQQH